jgi:hypothetical protein
MQEFESIRKKLVNAEAPAPDFDSLFKGETLGKDPLHAALQSKLAQAEVQAPPFEALFKNETLVQTKPVIRLRPWWTVAAVAAACMAVFFLLPDPGNQFRDTTAKAPVEVQKQAATTRKLHSVPSDAPKLEAQLLRSSAKIKPLKVEKRNTSVLASMAMNSESEESQRDTATQESLVKIAPTRNNGLFVRTNRALEEAYAAARIRKTRIKPDKVTFGLGMNSANRLLSMVNSKKEGDFALQSVASSGSDGYASLEGASTTMLRTTTTSPNDWIGPDNITAAMLLNCETTYSLPINLGLTVSIPIVHDLNLLTGIQYSYLANRISGNTFDLKQELHYLGIPIKLAVNLVKRGDVVVYTALGGTIEKGLAGVQTSTVDGEGTWKGTQSIQGFQTSLTGQFGATYCLKNNLLLYLEPGVAWYIPNNQPLSNRTEEPFNFNLSLGLRYRLP